MRLLVLLALSTIPFFSSLIYFLPSQPDPWVLKLLVATKFFLLLCPIWAFRYFNLNERTQNFFKTLRPQNLTNSIALGLGIGACMSAVVVAGFELLTESTQELALQRISQKISVLNIKNHFFVYGLALSFIHSLLEEFYWRFFIFNAWKDRLKNHLGPWGPHFIASLAFTLHHFTVTVHYFDLQLGLILGVGVFFAGIIWSLLYEKEKSLLTAWISHITVDLALISIGYLALTRH